MSEMQHGSFRRKVNFAAVSNNALKDARLSLKAKGLYALIQSYITLPNMRLTKSFLRNKCKEKEKAFDTAWKELKDCGYLKIFRIPSGKNDVFEYEYDLLDEANSTQPALITLNKQRETVKSKPINPHTPHKGEDADSDEERTNIAHIPQNGGDANSHTPHFVPNANGTPCEAHPMPNGGDNSNTKSGNTPSSNTLLGNIQSISQPSGNSSTAATTDIQTDEIRKLLIEQIDYDYFADNFPDNLDCINALIDCMTELLTNPESKINGTLQSRSYFESYISRVNSDDIRGFLDHMKGQSMAGIRNVSAYWRSAFLNYLRDDKFTMQAIKNW